MAINVLIVDDDLSIRRVYRRMVESLGFAVLLADSGDAAFEQLRAAPPVHLVLLDYLMPDMRGDEVLRRVRADFPAIPVVICSGTLTTHLAAALRAQGAAACLAKPVRRAELQALFAQLLPG